MLEDLPAALALTGGTTVVAAMATDAWQTVRDGIARLFRRGGVDQPAVITSELDGHAALIARAEDPEAARGRLAQVWQLHLEDLLRRCPEAEAELRVLVERANAMLPQAQATWVQTNIARDNGHVFASQGGNVVVHQGTPGQSAPTVHAPGQDTAEPE
jgi:hypothetical protein